MATRTAWWCSSPTSSSARASTACLEAAARLDDLHVLVVGRVDIAPYGERIERLGLRVKAVGSVSDVVAYHAAADVFALPTRYEPWGLVVVEALAAGLPVVTSRLAGSSVTVRDGETGVLLDDPDDAEELADGLRRMLAAPADDTAISASVAPYSWPEVARRYAAVLDRALGLGCAPCPALESCCSAATTPTSGTRGRGSRWPTPTTSSCS